MSFFFTSAYPISEVRKYESVKSFTHYSSITQEAMLLHSLLVVSVATENSLIGSTYAVGLTWWLLISIIIIHRSLNVCKNFLSCICHCKIRCWVCRQQRHFRSAYIPSVRTFPLWWNDFSVNIPNDKWWSPRFTAFNTICSESFGGL